MRHRLGRVSLILVFLKSLIYPPPTDYLVTHIVGTGGVVGFAIIRIIPQARIWECGGSNRSVFGFSDAKRRLPFAWQKNGVVDELT